MPEVGPSERSAPRKALVTGATGALGPALVDRLLSDGHRVRVLSRGRLPPPWPPGTVDLRHGDITDREAVTRAMEGVDCVFHLAAQLHVANPDPALATHHERVNVDGTRTVSDAAAASGVTRLVFFSTIAVYGPTGLEGADEDTPPRPDTLYARTKLQAEDLVRAAHSGRGPATTTLRLAAVYGPHVKGNYARLARALGSGWFVPIGPGLNRRTVVHEKDVADAALLAAARPEAAGVLYNVSDGEVYELRDILRAICRALDRRPPRLSLPTGLARTAARVGDTALVAVGREPRLSATLDKYTENVVVRAERIQRELGFRPRFGLESGWRDALSRARAAKDNQARVT